MGSLIGLVGGIGAVLMWWAIAEPDRPLMRWPRIPRIALWSLLAGAVVTLLLLAVTGVLTVAVVAGVLTSLGPSAVKRGRLSAADVPVLWGLELLALTVDAALLSIDEAERIAWRINETNPFITKALVESFVAKLKKS